MDIRSTAHVALQPSAERQAVATQTLARFAEACSATLAIPVGGPTHAERGTEARSAHVSIVAAVGVFDAFNELALNLGFGSVLSGLLTAGILVFGHTLNIVLGLMSVLVHGLRLNLLEFGTHLEMEWAGFRYNPFKKKD